MAGGRGPVWFAFDLQPGRGMGFSGAARAAAAVLAGVQRGASPDDARSAAYDVVSELEGHGDNAAPSVFGGVHIVSSVTHHVWQLGLPGELLLWVPDTESSTDASRSTLAPEVSRADAVFNIGQAALLVAAMYEADARLFAAAIDDRLHQAQRFATLPGSAAAAAAAEQCRCDRHLAVGLGALGGILCEVRRSEPSPRPCGQRVPSSGSRSIWTVPSSCHRFGAMTTPISDTLAELDTWLDDNWHDDRPLLEWRDLLADSGWGCPTWPTEWFGRGLARRRVCRSRSAA